jgi:beta-lactamase class A
MVQALLCVAPLLLASPAKTPSLAPLKKELDAICSTFGGKIGYSVKVLSSGDVISYNGDMRFPTASTIKTAILVEAINQVEEGKVKWTDQKEVPPTAERTPNMASQWAYFLKDGVKPNLDAWSNLMITYSDNTATKVCGMWMGNEAIRSRMQGMGLEKTAFLSYTTPDKTWFRRWNRHYGMGMTTPDEMRSLWDHIAQRKATQTQAGAERLLKILGRQYWDDWAGATAPPEIRVFNKTGAISRSRSETAYVLGKYPYTLSIFTNDQKDQRWVADNEGDVALGKICALVFNHLNPGQKYVAPPRASEFAPTGGGVE